MANSSFVITLSTPLSVADMGQYIVDASAPLSECQQLNILFSRLASGLLPGSFTVQTSANAPVRATQTLTLTYASISNNDTVVVAGVTLTCVTGTPDPTAGEFKKETDAATTAANLVALVNSYADTKVLVSAANVSGVVTFTSLAPGAAGNFLTLVGSTGMAAGAGTFAGGAGACETVPVTFTRG